MQQSVVENEYGNSSHLSFFSHFFEALKDAVKVQFLQGFIFTPYQRH